jgi:hypothetical protein
VIGDKVEKNLTYYHFLKGKGRQLNHQSGYIKIPLELSGAGKGLGGRDGEGDLTNVQYKLIWNCHNASLPVQRIYPNKKF